VCAFRLFVSLQSFFFSASFALLREQTFYPNQSARFWNARFFFDPDR
jgi:hypothetical protein